MKTLILQWNKLDELAKAFVVAAYNVTAFGVDTDVQARQIQSEVTIYHPKGGYTVEGDAIEDETDEPSDPSDVAVWDATASVTKDGLLQLDGYSGASGTLPLQTFVFPADVLVEVGVEVA